MEVYKEEHTVNSRGTLLFTCTWLPLSSPKALVFICHGYGRECSEYMKECGTRLAAAGYAAFGLDYEGHGKSNGPRCYIKSFQNIIDDCNDYFKSICEKEQYKDKCRFLFGESMGGAVALLLHKNNPSFWNGAVLLAPMCKISEKLRPPKMVGKVLTKMEEFIPKWKIVPSKNVIDLAFKDPVKREAVRAFNSSVALVEMISRSLEPVKNNKLIYQQKPRLKTALELLRTSISLERSLNEVTFPFLVLHGDADRIIDPEISKVLHEKASSSDKTIKLYPGMWHALMGEPHENVRIVFADITAWLDKRCDAATC
ncbi:hypothetical protein V6N12_066435 [Hibiscus sabdariffa]|uniref:Serine aminopeptidase S33 domain-containing protein n=1 Tax=Hibiscus sabdariffa TaxID=183260 RepID=A0ABR2CRU7_9ROSI